VEFLQAHHPDPETLAAFLNGELADVQQQQIESHVESCEYCCQQMRAVPADQLLTQLRHCHSSKAGETLALAQQSELETDSGEFHLASEYVNPEDIAIPFPLQEHPRYRIIKKLGAGGMGVVYLAEHRMMSRLVALKVVNAQLLNCQSALDRFHREVKAAARLTHRNIVTAFDAEQADDIHFLVMEYVEGKTLAEIVIQHGSLPVAHACHYIRQVAIGLQHAFAAGMIHRDIKPQNLMRTPKGVVKILDFGLARFATHQNDPSESSLTGDGSTVGTPDYIAPEQARNSRDADIRSDIYALGCTAYYLLAGRVPFPADSSLEKVLGHLQREPQSLTELRSDLPAELPLVIARMMAKQPADRFQTPIEVADSLKPFLTSADENLHKKTVSSADTKNNQASLANLFSFIEADNDAQLAATRPLLQPRKPSRPRSRILFIQTATALVIGVLIIFTAATWWWPAANSSVSETETVTASAGNMSVNPNDGAASSLKSGEWFNLIETVQLSDNVVAGNWQQVDGELEVAAGVSSRLEIPYVVPAEYDLEVTFTRRTGIQSVAVVFVVGNHQAVFDIDAWDRHLAGIQLRDGLNLARQPADQVAQNVQLVNGRKYTAVLKVRQRSIEAMLDDQLISRYEGEGTNLSLPEEFWLLPHADTLGVGAFQSETIFHTISLRPILP